MSSSITSSALTVVELAPLAEGTQDEHGDDAHPAGGDHRAGEDPEAEREPAVALALQLDEAVADQRAGETGQADGDEGGGPGGR